MICLGVSKDYNEPQGKRTPKTAGNGDTAGRTEEAERLGRNITGG